MELAESGVGCHWDGLFAGELAYADDLTCSLVLRMISGICECFGVVNSLKFNPDKTQCIRFPRRQGQ